MSQVVTPEGTYLFVRGLRWFYRSAGSGEPVILLHGIPTSSFLWRNVIPHLGDPYWVIAPDLPGFGRSDKPAAGAGSVSELAIRLGEFLERLGIDRCALVGHDLGALVATALLERWPERVTHLVVTNTSFRCERWRGEGFSPLAALRLPLLGELALALARPWMLRLAMRPFLAEPERLERATLDGYWEPFERSFRRTLLRLLRQPLFTTTELARWRTTLRERCGAGTIPVLIAWGARDPQFRVDEARELAGAIEGARLLLFERASHFLPEDRPRALARVIALFLERPEWVPAAR